MKNILIACEESQTVTNEFRKFGYNAFSCDILEGAINQDWHIQGDVLNILNKDWDLIIAFPPCTHLAISGAKHFKQKQQDGRQQQGIDFFMSIVNAKCDKIAIENPIGIMSTVYRKPDQIVQPYFFGDSYRKTTCLWLKNLPLLIPTNIVEEGEISVLSSGKKIPTWYSNASVKDRAKIRSRTFLGIAQAMVNQWSKIL